MPLADTTDYTTWTHEQLEHHLEAFDTVLTNLDEFRASPSEVQQRRWLEAQYDAIEAELNRRSDTRLNRAFDALSGVRLTLDE